MGVCLKRLYIPLMAILAVGALSLLVLAYYHFQSLHQFELLVKTKSGVLSGVHIERLGRKVRAFYGVPYADPPVGDYRFARPRPLTPWPGLYRADNPLVNICVQQIPNRQYLQLDKLPELEMLLKANVSEDCLYMNIFAPPVKHGASRAVMVWLYGGSFLSGYAGYYDAPVLTAYQDVIVVAVNYRIGLMGFLSAPPIVAGNMGLWDQSMALRWIKNNIAAFGGDPNRITLFGQSAGGISAGYHLLSPVSRDLFNRAIIQSGSPVIPISMPDIRYAANITNQVAILAGCPSSATNSSVTIISDVALECLRNASAEQLLEIQVQILRTKIYRAFHPIEDGEFLTGHPFELVTNQSFGRQKEILVGTNAQDGAIFMRYPYGRRDSIPANFGMANISDWLSLQAPKSGSLYYDLLVSELFADIDRNSSTQVWNRMVKVISDAVYICADYPFVNSFSQSKRHVFYYHFMPRASLMLTPFTPKWTEQASHADELPFMFGLPLRRTNRFTRSEIRLSEFMVKAWTMFAKTGRPSKYNAWREYLAERPAYMRLDVNGNRMVNEFPGLKCDQYYEPLYRIMRDAVRNGEL